MFEPDDVRERVVKALASLAEEKPVSKISVAQVSAEAGISRQTFYYHFDNFFDIYRWAVTSKLKHKGRSGNRDAPFLVIMFDWMMALEKNRGLTVAFSNSPYLDDFHEFLRAGLAPAARSTAEKRFGGRVPPEYIDFTVKYLIGGHLLILYDWFKDGMAASAEEVYKPMDFLMRAALNEEVLEGVVADRKLVG